VGGKGEDGGGLAQDRRRGHRMMMKGNRKRRGGRRGVCSWSRSTLTSHNPIGLHDLLQG
jgi:hypothetical protein